MVPFPEHFMANSNGNIVCRICDLVKYKRDYIQSMKKYIDSPVQFKKMNNNHSGIELVIYWIDSENNL